MHKTAPRFAKTGDTIPVEELARYADGWLLDGEIRQHSQRTLGNRRSIVDKLLWYLRTQKCEVCGTLELRQFLAYLGRGHEQPGGRWGNASQIKPVCARTVHTYHGHLRTFFRWMIEEGAIEASPMDVISAPISRADQIQPFTDKHIDLLIAAAKRSNHPKRDEAILMFLLDTGVRASELCNLRMTDVDLQTKRCQVLGKGNKHRSVYFGRVTAKALWNYLREDDRDSGSPVFLSDRGTKAGDPLTRSGLRQLFERLGEVAKLEATRCSPHTMRHTFAISFLRNGGNIFTLMQLLGHTSITMTNRYVALAQADIENQHRNFSPCDRRKSGGKV